jgi:hypothetical protein
MIIIECNNDKQLMHRLGFTEVRIRHAGHKSDVLKILTEVQKSSIGIVDEDDPTNQPKTLKQYEKIKEKRIAAKRAITLWKHKYSKNKMLIIISPRLEDWIYEVAKRNKIFLSRYDLPDDPDILHNDSSKETDKGFRNLLIAIVKKGDWEINLMRKWIKEAIQQ